MAPRYCPLGNLRWSLVAQLPAAGSATVTPSIEVHPEHLPKRLMIHKPIKVGGEPSGALSGFADEARPNRSLVIALHPALKNTDAFHAGAGS